MTAGPTFCRIEYGLGGRSRVICPCGNGRPSGFFAAGRDGLPMSGGVLMGCRVCGRILSPEGVVVDRVTERGWA